MALVQYHKDMPTIKLPLFGNSLKIMKFWSYLFVHNWRRYFAIIPFILLNLSQYFDLYHSSQPLEYSIRNIYLAMLFTNTIIRGVVVSLQRSRYEGLLELIKVHYLELLNSSDQFVQDLVAQTTRLSQIIARINLTMGSCTCIGFATYPIFAAEKVLPYGIFVPVIDKNASPYFQIFFAIQACMGPIGCCMYIPYTSLVVSFTLFAILMCKALQYKLRNLKGLNDEEVEQRIIWCIKYHLKISGLVDAMNKLTTNLYLVEFLLLGAMLCVLLFSMLIINTVGQKIIIVFYTVMVFSNSIIMYYVANELYFQSLYIATAAYESNWMDFNIKTQKTLKLLILRTQTPFAIMVGGVYPMNLKMLQSMLNTIYSFFTLLRRMYI